MQSGGGRMSERSRPYRDDELRQVMNVTKKATDFVAELHERYLGEAEQILVDIEVEFARLCEMMSDYDEEAQDE